MTVAMTVGNRRGTTLVRPGGVTVQTTDSAVATVDDSAQAITSTVTEDTVQVVVLSAWFVAMGLGLLGGTGP